MGNCTLRRERWDLKIGSLGAKKKAIRKAMATKVVNGKQGTQVP